MDITVAVGCTAPEGFSVLAAVGAAGAVMIAAHPVPLVARTFGGVNRSIAGGRKGEEHLRTIGHCCGDSVMAANGAGVHELPGVAGG